MFEAATLKIWPRSGGAAAVAQPGRVKHHADRTYFEGEATGVESAARGYSRDHRPDTLQVLVALVVTPEGFPVAYEVFDGDTADVTTLEEIVDKIESKYGMRGRVWVFDRGVVREDNLQDLRQRGAYYLVGTPRCKLANFERELLEG
ncbi:MAG: transposase, partial [Terrimicrobiaceae bacterium]